MQITSYITRTRKSACFLLLLIAIILCVAQTVWPQSNHLPTLSARTLFAIEADLLQPSDVVVGKHGHIYILDGVNGKVKVFSNQGTFLFAFGAKGTDEGQFRSPLGLGCDDAFNIYVADSGNHRIQIFDYRGEFIKSFDILSLEKNRPSDPTDVAVNSSENRCYVVDNGNHRILMYTRDGSQYIKQWGKRGKNRREFHYPFFIAVGHNNSVMVVDVINTRVEMFDPEGNFFDHLGGWGVNRGEFYRPKGIAVDDKNRIFVSDSVLGVVQVFNQYGSFLSVVGDDRGNILKFQTPVGICVDRNGRLYVVEMFMNRVQVLQLEE